MLDKPYFKSCYSVSTVEPDQVFLLSERETICLRDRFLYLVASLIDGDRSADEIIEAIQRELLPIKQPSKDSSTFFQEVLDVSIKAQSALFQMEKEGYLVEQDDPIPSNLGAFFHHLNVSSDHAHERLKSTKVAIESFDSLVRSDFIANLKSLHIQIADISDSDRADLTVVLTDDYLLHHLDEFNQKSLLSQVPWMLVKPVGTIIWLGPLFDSQQTACWKCLAHRLQDNRPVEGFVQRTTNQSVAPISPQGFLPSTLQTALSMAATAVFKWIVGGKNNQLKNTLITYDTLTHQSQEHFVVKRPQCPSCGQMSHRLGKKLQPVVLGHCKKVFIADGGHRSHPPEETLLKYRHHISFLTGIVRELSKLPGSKLTHTYIAKHYFLNAFDNLTNLQQNLEGRSAGKGKTDIQARTSAFCEAIERYSGVFQGDEIVEKGSYQQMGGKAIHPNLCMNFSQTQYRNREEWNADCSGCFQKVPEPFDDERVMEWTPVWSLTHQGFKYLPTAYCYYGYPESSRLGCWADSNGCAAGNTLEEAILQGFMELVERDCVALWWYNRLKKPQVDLDSFDDPYFQMLKQYYQTDLNREVWVLDLTSDFTIPTFAAISRSSDRLTEDIVLGFGAHFDPQIAISRALTEVNQVLPSVLSIQTDGRTVYPQFTDPIAITWWKNATINNQPYLIPDDTVTPKVQSDYPQLANDDFLEDIRCCQRIVEKHGMEILILDQTRPDVGLRVAKVIIPGMRHWWRRLGTGRLYEVPVKMGWLAEPLTEDQLNPFPMWM
jgi:oxazoline/thiazoline synthase